MAVLVDTVDLSPAQLTSLTNLAAARGITLQQLSLEMLVREIDLASEGVLFTQADLELRIGGPRYLVQLTDDDGDGIADVQVVSYIRIEASKIAKGILWGAWPSEDQIEALVLKDPAVLGFVCDLAAGIAGGRRPEWVTNDGKPFFGWRYERGQRELRKLSELSLRTPAEAEVGTNQTLAARTTGETPTYRAFLPTREHPRGRGGF